MSGFTFLRYVAAFAAGRIPVLGLSVALLGSALLGVSDAPKSATALPTLPPAPQKPVTDIFYGTSLVDPYRWMENLSDPDVQHWMKAQSDYTNTVLAALPGRAPLLAKMHSLVTGSFNEPYGFQLGGARIFYKSIPGGAELPSLFLWDSSTGKSHLVFDPASVPGGAHIDLYAPSNSGRYVALSLSAGGTEQGTLRVVDTATGNTVGTAIDNIHTSWTVPSWLPGDKAFFYTRFLKTAGQVRGQVVIHRLGADPSSDALVFGYGVAPNITPAVGMVLAAPDSGYVVGVAVNGTSTVDNFYTTSVRNLESGRPHWRALGAAFLDVHIADPGTFGFFDAAIHRDSAYFVRLDAARRTELVEVPLSQKVAIAQARVILPAGDSVIDNIAAGSDALYIATSRAGISHLMRFDFKTRAIAEITLPAAGSTGLLSANGTSPGVAFSLSTWTKDDQPLTYLPASRRVEPIAVTNDRPQFDAIDLVSDEVLATSADGTSVPLSIVHAKGLNLDGSHPALLYGYGAYGTSVTPFFDPTLLPWFERGGVYAVAHPRGGGEFGEPWHEAGKGSKRQHSIDDFVACAKYLISAHYTVPSKLGIWGESAGGTLIANAFLQQPRLFGFAIDSSGALDLIRGEISANGSNQVPEVGSTRTLAGFQSMYAMSPYQHVVPGTAYPAVLLTTGTNDPRVPPWTVIKMVARLQAATASGKPVLLRVTYGAGHSGAANLSQAVDLRTDLYAFAMWRAGDADFQPR